MDAELDIAEVARLTGLAPSALRYYERKGLIEPSGRAGLRRQYPPGVVDRLALVLAASQAGFGLDEIREVFDGRHADADVRAAIARKIDEIDRRIDVLSGVRERLAHATTCPSSRLLDCPHLLEGARQVLPPQPS